MMMKQARDGGPVFGFSMQNWLSWMLASFTDASSLLLSEEDSCFDRSKI